jgi:hypothetical protein
MNRISAAARAGRRPSARRAEATSGFTLVEAIISAGILGLVVVGIYAAITTNVALVELCRENGSATQILTEKLDTIRLYNWDQINSNGFVPKTFTVALDPSNTNGRPYYTGTVVIAAAPVTEPYSPELRQVTVTLNWLSGRRPQTRSMTTFVTRNGLQEYITR